MIKIRARELKKNSQKSPRYECIAFSLPYVDHEKLRCDILTTNLKNIHLQCLKGKCAVRIFFQMQ